MRDSGVGSGCPVVQSALVGNDVPKLDSRSARELMLASELYQADDPELNEGSVVAARRTAEYNALPLDAEKARMRLLRSFLGFVGDDVCIRAPFHCDYGTQIRIGARTFINAGFVALDCAAITIGEDVQIATNVQLLTATHPVDPELRRAKWESAHPITIGDNAWLGGGAIVLPGVTIGANGVVGAGAVVTKDVPPNVVVVGNPARVLRQI